MINFVLNIIGKLLEAFTHREIPLIGEYYCDLALSPLSLSPNKIDVFNLSYESPETCQHTNIVLHRPLERQL
jgi:hypothetical protein